MTSVCTGALVFADASLLDGRAATTHWSALDDFPELGRIIDIRSDQRFVDSSDVTTDAGVSAGIDVALHLVARLPSAARARCQAAHPVRYGATGVSDPQGLAFDSVAVDYDRGRPGWPAQMLEDIEAVDVLDLAAGSGKLTRLLLERYPNVIAVEPLAGMRALLPLEAEVLDGLAEAIPLPSHSVDAVFVAEAFHWFDSRAAVGELARVLRPGGITVVCFNEWRGPYQPPIGERAHAVLDERRAQLPLPGGPKVDSGEWKLGFLGQPFSPLEERSYDHEMETDRDGVAAYYVSTSATAHLPPAERAKLRAELVEALADVRYRLLLTARVYKARSCSGC